MQIENIIETLQATGFEAEILPDFAILQPKSQKTLSKQSRIGRTTCANCANSIEKILQSLPAVKGHPVDLTTSLREIKYVPSAINKDSIVQIIEDGCFETAFLQSSKQTKISLCLTGFHTEKDVDILHDVLKKNYLRQCDVNTALSESEIVFDPETIGLRSIVHTIQMGINGRLQMHVQDLYTQKSSNTAQVASKISKLPHSSLFLSLLESFEKSFPTLRFPPLPERADFDLKDVLEAPYFFN